MHRYLELQRRNFERVILTIFSIGALVLFVIPENTFTIFSDWVWHPTIMLIGLYLYLLIYIHAWKRKSTELHIMGITGSIMVMYGAHDTLIKIGAIEWGNGFYLPYSAASSLVVFSTLLVIRFAKTLDSLESLSKSLNMRVQAATAEVEKNLLKVQLLERQQILSHERERVARDIHDGVGGQLVTLLSRIKTGHNDVTHTEAGLQQAVDDLRLVISSLDLPEGDLGTALATWRYRLEKIIEGCNIQLVWEPSNVNRLLNFGPSDILQVLRLLDEAATNVIQHANCSRITLKFGQTADEFYIYFSDNGTGGAEEQLDGHGLKNMQRRARDLNAELNIYSSPAGTNLQLHLPIKRA